jgi:hypothetical protein
MLESLLLRFLVHIIQDSIRATTLLKQLTFQRLTGFVAYVIVSKLIFMFHPEIF